MKGLIICGYPGVGKSSIAGWNNCIDLDSSWFSQDSNGDRIYPDEAWCVGYCKLALELASQGFTVLISTHKCVINQLREWKNGIKLKYKVPVVIFAPRPGMKKEWICRLLNRYLESEKEIDLRAFIGGIEYWDEKLLAIVHSDIHVYAPDSIDYDLRDYVLKIREKEGIVDDPKNCAPMETMAGVEESCMDDPLVEETIDISEADP